jgi:acyl carrier protein
MESETRLLEKIRNYISKATLLNDDAIKNDTLIFELGLLDSMGLLFLIDFIKSEFNVDVNDAELIKENFESVNNISEFVYNKLNVS